MKYRTCFWPKWSPTFLTHIPILDHSPGKGDLLPRWQWISKVNLDKFLNQFPHKAPQVTVAQLINYIVIIHRNWDALNLVFFSFLPNSTCSQDSYLGDVDSKSFELFHQQHGFSANSITICANCLISHPSGCIHRHQYTFLRVSNWVLDLSKLPCRSSQIPQNDLSIASRAPPEVTIELTLEGKSSSWRKAGCYVCVCVCVVGAFQKRHWHDWPFRGMKKPDFGGWKVVQDEDDDSVR